MGGVKQIRHQIGLLGDTGAVDGAAGLAHIGIGNLDPAGDAGIQGAEVTEACLIKDLELCALIRIQIGRASCRERV